MIKKPRQWFESNPMDRYVGSSYPMSSSDKINELWEEDLWPVDLKEADLEAVEDRKTNNGMEGQFVIRSTGFHGSLWMIPRMGDSSSDADLRQHQSAPVNVPDWSKILGVNYLKEQNPFAIDVEMAGDEEEEEEKGDRVPPHEYLAREDARCRVFTKASILQGVGLKGREMSRIRNAVWRQTGFLG